MAIDAELDALLVMATEGGEVGAEGIDQLVARGAEVVPAMVEAIDSGSAVPLWTAVLIALEDEGRVPAMVAHLGHANPMVRAALVQALGRSGDAAALPPLLDELARGRHLLAAVTALGDLGQAGAVAPLRARVAALLGDPFSPERLAEVRARALEDGDPSDPLLIAACAGSLARLKDMSLAPAMRAIAVVGDADEDPYAEAELRLEAVYALDIVVARGVAGALHAACRDPDGAVADAAVDAIARIGRAADVARWIETAEQDPDRGDVVLRGIELVTGMQPDAGDLAAWWRETGGRFQPGVSYVGGEPASPGVLLAGLRGPDVGLVKRDLRQRTGLPFVLDFFGGDPATPRELARIERWWTENQPRFPAGRLHRWGRVYASDDVE